jgi:hypothetical protein
MNPSKFKPSQLLAITLSVPLAYLTLSMPSLAAGKIALKSDGTIRTGRQVTYEVKFNLIAHPDASYYFKPSLFNVNENASYEVKRTLGVGYSSQTPSDTKETHGTKSEHVANVNFLKSPADDNAYDWTLDATALIKPSCVPNDGKCGAVTAISKVTLYDNFIAQGEKIFTAKINEDGTKVNVEGPAGKDPTITLSLDDVTFFAADIYANSPLLPGLEPTLNADFSFGTLGPEIELILFHGGYSCALTACSSNALFLSSLQSMISTGPGGNWSFDSSANAFFPNNDITVPAFLYTNSSNPQATASLGIGTQGSDPGVEVPGPVPILGIPAFLSFSRKLRNRIGHGKAASVAEAGAPRFLRA